MESIRYAGLITPDIFDRAQRLHMGKRLSVMPWMFPVLMTAFLWWQEPDQPLWQILSSFPIFCLFPLLFRWLIAWQWRRLYAQSPYLREPGGATITEEGIVFTSVSVTGKVPWGNIIKAKTSADLVLLYQAPIAFVIVPSEFFATDNLWQEALTVIRSRPEFRA